MRILIFLLGFLITFNSESQNKECPLIPLPTYYISTPEIFKLTEQTWIIHDEDLTSIGHFLQKELLRHKGLGISTTQEIGKKDFSTAIILRLSPEPITEKIHGIKSDEVYSINMGSDEIIIKASHEKGVFNGVVSLIQMIRMAESKNKSTPLNCFYIEDAPLYEWRGLMLDESRHFFGKEKVKQLLDWMALYKLNRFHWHLTDSPGWRIEIKQFPKLALIGGIGNNTYPYTQTAYYTQEDISEIVLYASERFIEIIPEIDMPGHAAAANKAYPEYSGGGSERYPEFTFNPGKEEVYSYLTSILREVDALFPSQIIHIGGDEVHFGNEKWNTDEDVLNLMRRNNFTDLKQVEEYFVKRMADSLAVINNKMAAWDEVAGYDLSNEKTIVYYWRSRRPEQLQKSLDGDFPIVMCPNRVFYLDYRQDSTHVLGWQAHINSLSHIYDFSPYSLPVEYKKGTNILGVQANIWSEIISTDERLDFMTFPRIAALAETAWNDEGNKDFEKFNKRLKQHLDLYREGGIYFYNPFNPDENKEPMK